MKTTKDGGPQSLVWAHTFIEIKPLFSIILLRFEDGSREAYHEHAFNCVNWLLTGELYEEFIAGTRPTRIYNPSWKPFMIFRKDSHKVTSRGRSYVLSFRGPWVDTWREFVNGRLRTLTHGRVEL